MILNPPYTVASAQSALIIEIPIWMGFWGALLTHVIGEGSGKTGRSTAIESRNNAGDSYTSWRAKGGLFYP